MKKYKPLVKNRAGGRGKSTIWDLRDVQREFGFDATDVEKSVQRQQSYWDCRHYETCLKEAAIKRIPKMLCKKKCYSPMSDDEKRAALSFDIDGARKLLAEIFCEILKKRKNEDTGRTHIHRQAR